VNSDRLSEVFRRCNTFASKNTSVQNLTDSPVNAWSLNPSALVVRATVAEYRAFTVGRDGHFSGFEPLICADDAEAIAQAKRLVGDNDVELWSGGRLVIRLEAKTK
jgi:hypothetical protein